LTQKEQVIAAIKSIGGKGTPKEILNAIGNTETWKAQNPQATVNSILSRGRGKEFKKESDFWIYVGDETSQNSTSEIPLPQDASLAQQKADARRGLYFITLSNEVKRLALGFLFKIGSAKDIRVRLKQYNPGLPFNPIKYWASYHIPTDINLQEAEKQVRTKLLENDSLGHSIYLFPADNQREWLQIQNLILDDENIYKLDKVIKKIVDDVIVDLRKKRKFKRQD